VGPVGALAFSQGWSDLLRSIVRQLFIIFFSEKKKKKQKIPP
jgi:hypothetical protein